MLSSTAKCRFHAANGNYCVTLAMLHTQPVHTWGYQKRNFKVKRWLEESKTISCRQCLENEILFGVENLPYVAHEVTMPLSSKIIRYFHFLLRMRGCSLQNCIWGCGKIA